MLKILFIAAHRPDRSPSQRYRFEQFTPYWEKHGFSHRTAWLLDEADDKKFYASGNLAAKGAIFLKCLRRRAIHVREAKEYDLIFVQREAFMTGSTRFEKLLARTGVPMIYEFDDAIWHLDVSEGNRKLAWLKDPGKIAKIIPLATHVIAGNEYLADYARPFNPNVEVIPTVVDTERYVPLGYVPRPDGKIVIGWTGSHTSMAHLIQVIPMLRSLYAKYLNRIVFRVISDRAFEAPGLPIENILWNSITEPEDLAPIDIGIMPIPDNEWSRGKCGFKGLQYMGMGKAVVLSRVGVNVSMVNDGENGFLADSEDEWIEKLGQLIQDSDLRGRLGRAARSTVEQKYSVIAWRDRYLELFRTLIENKPSIS
ncbi:MAG: glycosyltransferase family 4 protein [Flavobacteriales bacterium]|nr:glycosyltransferase family 4 protein [Flavobacteriales bacterium]MBK6945260.1 glycosyltransferase family 4 protein [Flavobacteriales bacterium]MBK7239611.1 glycosyltransferase family 4 protein [Flavobacteriales bacterium]MBK9535183.1 glycosyltransferase family 4 protein [Flavobacteriales bacterium]MBP9137841.1 glycosyltransferase family 4 protein [Flavobacteriales bacterium]